MVFFQFNCPWILLSLYPFRYMLNRREGVLDRTSRTVGARDHMNEERDFLDEIVEESTARNPEFPQLVDAAERVRRVTRMLAEARERRGLTQAEVARRMGTSQPAIARLERGEADPRLSTVERYAQVVGIQFEPQGLEPRPA